MCHFFEHALRKFVAYPRRSYYTVFRVKVLWQVRLESLESGEGKLVVEEKNGGLKIHSVKKQWAGMLSLPQNF
jgi:hypothetical protein